MPIPNEATFIYLGMNKEKWPCLNPETIQSFLDDPALLDGEEEPFLTCFYYYHEWYWNNQRSK